MAQKTYRGMKKKLLNTEHLRTWIDIDKASIGHNYRAFRKLIGKRTKLLGVVKSNAYGHDLIEFSKELARLGVDCLGVDSLVEGTALRKAGVKTPILVLGHTLPVLFGEARKKNIAVTISNFDTLRESLRLPKNKEPLRVHVKVDTGMHRQGFQLHECTALLDQLGSSASQLIVEGLYTHFAEAKNPRSGDNTRRQIKEFVQWITAFRAAGLDPMTHASATGGAMLYPAAHYDMVRIGIGMYGLWPSSEAERALSGKMKLKSVLSWRAVVSEVKSVKKGDRVGYDLTEMLTRETKLAVIPVGYWHGFPRLLSSKGRVLIHGKTARVVGRVSMDMVVVDVTDIPKVASGDKATLIGKDGKEEIKASELAQFGATTHYEIVTRLNPLMKRFYH
jgi:alanine racemase